MADIRMKMKTQKRREMMECAFAMWGTAATVDQLAKSFSTKRNVVKRPILKEKHVQNYRVHRKRNYL